MLAEQIMVNGRAAGYLLLGERGVGEGYDRQERIWVSALAAHLGTALEQARRRLRGRAGRAGPAVIPARR